MYPCVRKILSVGGVSGSVFWLIIVGRVGGDDRYRGGNPYRLTKADYGYEGAEKNSWDMGETSGQRGVEGIWNTDRI